MKTYSVDLREKIVEAVELGTSKTMAARDLRVSRSRSHTLRMPLATGRVVAFPPAPKSHIDKVGKPINQLRW